MKISRRGFISGGGAVIAAAALQGSARAMAPVERVKGSRFKLSCAAYSYRKYLTGASKDMDLFRFLDLCAEMGLDGAELTSYYFEEPTTPQYLRNLKRRAFLLGLDVSGTAIRNDFCVAAGEPRRKQMDEVRMRIDQAAELGAPVIRVFGGSAPKGVTEEDAIKRCIEALQEACGIAGERGIILGLENHGGITSTAEQLVTIVKGVNSPWVGINLDTGNFRGADPYKEIEMAAPYAVTVQVKTEITPAGGQKMEADLGRELDILRGAGYRGYVALEYEAQEDPKTAVPKHLAQLRALIDQP